MLSPSGIKAVDDYTVVFTLDAPTASFPYLTSNTTYQSIILPAGYKDGTFTTTPQTTGAFNLVSYTPGVGAKFDRNPSWWGGKAPLDGVDVTYYTDESAAVAAVLSGQIDMMSQTSFSGGRAAFSNPSVQILSVKGAPHREISMLTQTVATIPPLKNALVRQALALTLDRPAIVKQLFDGFGTLGNDSPWASLYPVVRQDRSAAPSGSRSGEEAPGAGRLPERVQRHAHAPRSTTRSPSSRRFSKPRRRRSASTSSSTS